MRTSEQAVAAARATTRNRHGWCLWHVQEWFAAPHVFPGARQQWEGARRKHRGDTHPPAGVPVYFDTSSRWDHIAISLGGGMCRSTDAAGAGFVADRPLGWFTRWGGTGYLGWSEDIGGRDIPGIAHPTDQPPPHPRKDDLMRIIEAAGKGSGLYGPGYFHQLTKEERDVLVGQGVPYRAGNAREFDVIRAAMLHGQDAGK